MSDGGFVNGQINRILPIVTKGQLGGNVEDEIKGVIEEVKNHAEVWVHGPKDKLLKGIAGQLRLQATLEETPDSRMPNRLSDTRLNTKERIRLLRYAADLLTEGLST